MEVQILLPDDFTLIGHEELADNLVLAKKAIEIIAHFCELTDQEFVHIIKVYTQGITLPQSTRGNAGHNLVLAKKAIDIVAQAYKLSHKEFINLLQLCAQAAVQSEVHQ